MVIDVSKYGDTYTRIHQNPLTGRAGRGLLSQGQSVRTDP